MTHVMETRAWFAAALSVCLFAIGLVVTAPDPVGASTAPGDSGSIAAGGARTCAIDDLGGLWCWGANTFGALGDGTTDDRSTPAPVVGLGSGVAAVSSGIDHTCALTDTGGVKCWGLNNRGQLGDGTTTNSSTPVDVVGLSSGVTAMATGNLHTCALTDAGGVKCWGSGGGALGDGNTANSSTPVDVVGLSSGVDAIAPGANLTCALTDVGGVKCWGHNSRGGVGDGTFIDRLTPVDVVGLSSGVTFISAYGNLGGSRACAIASGGALKCWGDNTSAQLGDGTTTNRSSPVDVVGLGSGVAAVSTGTSQTCALTDGGGVKCWGAFGVGDGVYSGDLRTTPVDVVGLASGVDEIDSGRFHACARKSSGALVCWGSNVRGELGQGQTGGPWSLLGAVPRDVSGSFHRDECPTLLREAHTDFSMTDGYGVGSTATFVADPGYALDGPATLTCQPDLTWDGAPPPTVTTGVVSLTPASDHAGGQLIDVGLSGFAPSVNLGWAQCIVFDPPSQNNCSAPIGQGQADATGALDTSFRLQRFIYVPAPDRWVDCADPAETCVMAAADIANILDSAAITDLDFAPPPAPPSELGVITLDPASVTAAGETVTVTGTGFRPGAFVDVYQCVAAPSDPSACNRPVASLEADGSGGFVVDVVAEPIVEPPGGTPTDCFAPGDPCVIAAAEAVDFPGTVVASPLVALPVAVPGLGRVVEGDTGLQVLEIPLTLSKPSGQTVTVEWDTIWQPTWSPTLTAEPGVDYQPVGSPPAVEFAPGETEKTVAIDIVGDMIPEAGELVVVSFHTPTNARLGGFYGLGLGVIENDDAVPIVLPGAGVVVEGDSGTQILEVEVALSEATGQSVTVQWATIFEPGWSTDVAAQPGVDYAAGSGQVEFAPGETLQTVTVEVDGDELPESDELVVVSFTSPVNAAMNGYWGLGFGVIEDDDPA